MVRLGDEASAGLAWERVEDAVRVVQKSRGIDQGSDLGARASAMQNVVSAAVAAEIFWVDFGVQRLGF